MVAKKDPAVLKEKRSLNPLFRMAVLAGVESAVRMHVQRGDDLDAQDKDGMTPLMLAAAKNRADICALLLSSGADASLLDCTGRDALEIAKALFSGKAAAVLRYHESMAEKAPFIASEPVVLAEVRDACNSILEAKLRDQINSSSFIVENSIGGGSSPNFDAWEVQVDGPPPVADEAITATSSASQNAISDHRPIDSSEAWEAFDAFLPERAASVLMAGDDERREKIRRILLRAMREGSVPAAEVEALCANQDEERDPAGEALLQLVLGDLGAETDERTGVDAICFDDEDEELEITSESDISEAMAFLDDLNSTRMEPMKIYLREIARHRLLTAGEETQLAKEIEEGAAAAIDALCSWPNGIAAILREVERVRRGEVAVEDLSTGGMLEPSVESWLRIDADTVEQDECAVGLDPVLESTDESFEESVGLTAGATDFLNRTEMIARLAGRAGKGGKGEEALKDALTSANLSRSFLLSLVTNVRGDGDAANVGFTAAMSRQSLARERFVVSNLRLSLSIARRYQGRGLSLDDLVQEGNIGLLKAVDRFDWRKGFRFSTYATWWIRQQVSRSVADKGKTIRMPVHMHDLMTKVSREVEVTERETGRAASVGEIAQRMSLTSAKVITMLARMDEPLPLHEPGVDGVVLGDVLVDPTAEDPSVTSDKAELSRLLHRFLADLDSRAAEVITSRFGLDGNDSHTLDETGQVFGVTRERIRQIEAQSLRKLRHPLRTAILRDFLGTKPTSDKEISKAQDCADIQDDNAQGETPPSELKKATRPKNLKSAKSKPTKLPQKSRPRRRGLLVAHW